MVKPSPATAFVVSQPGVLLEFLVDALDAPALVRRTNQVIERCVLGQR